ncbi:hypothetical protein [Thermoflavimicrobium dichotomicum]|uniref:Uncharacterized protein n=1 Tax=Thermoflavimicrobium dichotomicum TaxID=46223 RepID=A0A1I3TDF4_9BACL|nr:hypothetical protein [Thermoflavimicrobium dichotomicum]SFJ69154.1 hypothetical protein SAMN05421852_11729 [Thermoflavimicrobium dichotomicum]
MSSPHWIQELLQTHFSAEELQRVEPLIHTESWVSPSARYRQWFPMEEELPIRFHVGIDIKV